MITFQLEDIEVAIRDFKELQDKHWEEVNYYKTKNDLEVDYDAYRALYNTNQLLIMTARNDGRLVGYNVMMILKNPHSSDIYAANDLLFVIPKLRGTRVPIKLIRAMEEALKNNYDLSSIEYTSKVHADYGRLLNKLSYTPIEVTHAKLIKRGN